MIMAKQLKKFMCGSNIHYRVFDSVTGNVSEPLSATVVSDYRKTPALMNDVICDAAPPQCRTQTHETAPSTVEEPSPIETEDVWAWVPNVDERREQIYAEIEASQRPTFKTPAALERAVKRQLVKEGYNV